MALYWGPLRACFDRCCLPLRWSWGRSVSVTHSSWAGKPWSTSCCHYGKILVTSSRYTVTLVSAGLCIFLHHFRHPEVATLDMDILSFKAQIFPETLLTGSGTALESTLPCEFCRVSLYAVQYTRDGVLRTTIRIDLYPPELEMPQVMWLGQPESMTLPHSVQEAQSEPSYYRFSMQGWGSCLACTMGTWALSNIVGRDWWLLSSSRYIQNI